MKDDVPLQAHEYIHVLQGHAEGPEYWSGYLTHALIHRGGPTQEEEAIAYLWQGYILAFGKWRLGEYGDAGPWKYFVPLPRRTGPGGY